MSITFTDSVKTATFDHASGSIKINLEWWESLPDREKVLVITHEIGNLKAWRKRTFNQCVDYAINADVIVSPPTNQE